MWCAGSGKEGGERPVGVRGRSSRESSSLLAGREERRVDGFRSQRFAERRQVRVIWLYTPAGFVLLFLVATTDARTNWGTDID